MATVLLGLLAAGWIIQGIRAYRGMSRIPRLSDVPPLAAEDSPRVSILFAARDEAARLSTALTSLLSLDYPNYEVVAVDDRSHDATSWILDEFAARDPRLSVIHVRELPAGWLGKPHALELAYRRSTGEWLVFTDADVSFAPDLLRRALALAEQSRCDHLTLLAEVELRGFWETTAVAYLGMGFVFGVQPWRVSDPKAASYMGVGAFQLLRRSSYETIGTHRRLAMEVVDDMKLGKLVKQSGYRSGIAAGESFVRLRWHDGLGEVIQGLTKNLFAGFGYRLNQTLASVLAIFVISILPFAALFFIHGIGRAAAAIAVAAAMALQARLMAATRISPFFGLTHPLGAALFIYMILRSAAVTLWRGGVLWRETFYPLEELRKGSV